MVHRVGCRIAPATLALIALAMLWLPTAAPAYAATFAVTSTADEVDVNPGDGICASTPSGACTLRAAILEANALPGEDAIALPAGEYVLTIAGQGEDQGFTGDLDILASLTITGDSASTTIVNAKQIDRVFTVASGASVTMSRLTITGGSQAVGLGPGNAAGGGIVNRGDLTLRDVEVTHNEAAVFSLGLSVGQAGAGGIANWSGARLTLENVTLADNQTSGKWADSGGLYNGGSATLVNVTFSSNTVTFYMSDSGGGGGILNDGTMELANVTFSGNTARQFSDSLALAQSITNRGTMYLRNTLIQSPTGPNCGGRVTSVGNNLETGDTCGLTSTSDVQNTDPRLGPLANNGGQTRTHALLEGSPAIDRGTNERCTTADQRGQPRPRDGDGDGGATCDVGSYEVQAPFPVGLSIAGHIDPPLVQAGGGVTVGLDVTNERAAAVAGAVLQVALPPGARYLGSDVTGNRCDQPTPTELRCALGVVPGNQGRATAIVRFAAPPNAGLLTVSARVWTTAPELTPDNNQVVLTAQTWASCQPRPPVRVQTTPLGNGRLQVTISATETQTMPSNELRAIVLGVVQNATVEAGGLSYGSNSTVPLAAGNQSATLVVQRTTAGQPFLAPLTVTDGCGTWPTLVGGGRDVP